MAFAQQGEVVASDPAPAAEMIVRGLSADDLLKVREEPSALGKTIGQLPNGALVEKLECRLVDRYEWCRVDAVDVADLAGWTPARYLQSLAAFSAEMKEMASDEEPGAAAPAPVPIPQPAPREEAPLAAAAASEAGESTDTDAPAAIAEDAGTGDAVEQAGPAADEREAEAAALLAAADGEPEVASPNPVDPAVERREARIAEEQAVSALPPGLAARFAGAAPAPLAYAEESEPERVEPPAASKAPEAQAALERAAPNEAAAPTEDASVPVPTPRPGSRRGAVDEPKSKPKPGAQAPEQVALAAEAPATTASAYPRRGEVAGEVPCARYVGQPMARCILMVARTGAGAADVTVVWPDGGTRLIEFRDGVPAGSNSRDEFRFTREGSLNLIRIGMSERFEILDALAFEN